MIDDEHRRKWLIYLLWTLLLAGVIAMVWWYYSRKINQLDRELDRVCLASSPCIKKEAMKHTILTIDYESPVCSCSWYPLEGPSGHHPIIIVHVIHRTFNSLNT